MSPSLDQLEEKVVSLVNLALRNEGLIVLGYTHLQRAQPVLLPHLLLAYVEQNEQELRRERRKQSNQESSKIRKQSQDIRRWFMKPNDKGVGNGNTSKQAKPSTPEKPPAVTPEP